MLGVFLVAARRLEQVRHETVPDLLFLLPHLDSNQKPAD